MRCRDTAQLQLTMLHMCSYHGLMIDPLDTRSLRPAREAAGLNRLELAERAGVDETTILRIEKGGTDPRLTKTWAPIVRALTQSSMGGITA